MEEMVWRPIKCMTYQTNYVSLLRDNEVWRPIKCMTYQT